MLEKGEQRVLLYGYQHDADIICWVKEKKFEKENSCYGGLALSFVLGGSKIEKRRGFAGGNFPLLFPSSAIIAASVILYVPATTLCIASVSKAPNTSITYV